MTTQTVSGITIEKPTQAKLDDLGVKSWPIWTKEASTFDWTYDDKETCFLLEGKVTVKTKDGEVSFGKGDLVTFPAGLSCVWQVQEGARKHYNFG